MSTKTGRIKHAAFMVDTNVQGKDDDFIGYRIRRAPRMVSSVMAGFGICKSSGCSLFGSEGGRMAEAQTLVFRV